MEIIRIQDGSWRIEDEGVRFFLLEGDENAALLIDSGMTVRNAKEIAEDLTSLPVSLVNTHADPDHIGSNEEFDSFLMHPAETVNYCNVQQRKGRFVPVEEGEIIDLGNRKLRIISTPGHTPGSIAILDEENRVLIPGDSIQDGGIFMFGIMREFQAYIESLRKLEGMSPLFDSIWPSHGSLPLDPAIIPQLIDGAERCLNGELPTKPASFMGQEIRIADAGVARFLIS